MANIKSKKKNIRRIAKQTAGNRHVKSTLKTLFKRVKTTVQEGNAEEIKKAVSAFVSALDKAAKRHIIHSNKANRYKGMVAKFLTPPSKPKSTPQPTEATS